MRLVLSVIMFGVFLATPHVLRSFPHRLSPRQRIWIATCSLAGIAVGFFGLLGAIVAPNGLGVPDAFAAIEICLTAGSKLFQHPLRHWPSILSAALLLSFLFFLSLGVVLTWRDARRAIPKGAPMRALPGASGRVLILGTDELLAFTAGLFRPTSYVTSGLITMLPDEEFRAVLEHERAHARGGHVPLLFAARVIRRSFGFVPGCRVGAAELTSALEASADRSAAGAMGDPMVVLRAIEKMATSAVPVVVPAMNSGQLVERVRDLVAPETSRRLVWIGRLAAALLLLVLVGAQLLTWSTGQKALAHEALALRLHRTCHLPH